MTLMQQSAVPGVMKNVAGEGACVFVFGIPLVNGILKISVRSCGILFNTRVFEGESMRVFPLSNWTESDIWHYIQREDIPIVGLYFAKERAVVRRGVNLIPADDVGNLKDGEEPTTMCVRFRTLGCAPCTGAVASEATTLEEIAIEADAAIRSERETRVIDHGSNTMEDKKKEGYF